MREAKASIASARITCIRNTLRVLDPILASAAANTNCGPFTRYLKVRRVSGNANGVTAHGFERQIRVRRADPGLGALPRPGQVAGAARNLRAGRADRDLLVQRQLRRI